MVKEEKIFKVFYIDIYKGIGPAPWRPCFFYIIMNFRNLQEGHLRTIPAKYQYNLAIGFRRRFFKVFYKEYILGKLTPPPGSHALIDIIMNFRKLQEDHLKTISIKFHYNLACGFRVEDF